MLATIEVLQYVGVFVAGLLARVGIFLAMVAILVVPALGIALVVRWVGAHRRRALGLRRVAGLLFRPGVAYSPGHTWLERRRGGALEIGLDDLAQRLLPWVSTVVLPRPGTRVARGDPIATLHGGGRAVPIPSPVAGTVAGVNAAVLRDPALVKQDGFGKGWLVVLDPADPAWQAFPRGDAAEAFMRAEAGRLGRFLEERLGFAAADGGELVAPAPWLAGEQGWQELTAAFLRA